VSSPDPRVHFLARQQAFVASLGDEPAWRAKPRAEAIAAFADGGLPHTKLEEWRYTNVAPIAKVAWELAAPPAHQIDRADLESHAFPVFACSVFVFVNGRFAPELSAGTRLPGGARVESLAALRTAGGEPPAAFASLVDAKQHPFAALNTAFFDDGAVIRIPRGGDVGQPIHLVFVSAPTDVPSVIHPRVLVEAEPGSRACLIQDFVSVGNAAGFTNSVTELRVGENAALDFVLLQREPDHRFHVANLAVHQQRASRFSGHTLTFGGALVRNDASVLLAEEGAECSLDGLFVGGGSQLLDNHTLVDHAVPHCTSDERYKGILGGGARGVFRGRVLVRPDAQKTRANQSSRNLLLGARAEIDTKPQLEIYADDVKCSHGSTIGQLDPDALFFLRSRGIGESRARDLLTRAFGLEILEALPSPALAQALDELLLARLRHARLASAEESR
jgi:Fe-S cluster assembly protein SufD